MFHLLNISEFVYFVWGLSPPKRCGEILHNDAYVADHVQNTGCVLCLQGSSLPKNDIFKNCLHVGLQFCSDDGSVGWLALAGCGQGLCC